MNTKEPADEIQSTRALIRKGSGKFLPRKRSRPASFSVSPFVLFGSVQSAKDIDDPVLGLETCVMQDVPSREVSVVQGLHHKLYGARA